MTPSSKILNFIVKGCNLSINNTGEIEFYDPYEFGKSHNLPFLSLNLALRNYFTLYILIYGVQPFCALLMVSNITYFLWMITADIPRSIPSNRKVQQLRLFNTLSHLSKINSINLLKFFNLTENTKKIQLLYLNLGISCQFSCSHTLAQNGRVERKHRHVVETGLTLIAQANLTLNYWWDDFLTVVILINGMPTPTLKYLSPIELLFHHKLNFFELKIFGCAYFSCLRPYQTNKFSYYFKKCIYLSSSPIHEGFKCLSKSGKVHISRHVRFNENEFPFL